MLRLYLIPESNKLEITIPDNYIEKKVEVIIFSEDEIQEIEPSKTTNNTSELNISSSDR